MRRERPVREGAIEPPFDPKRSLIITRLRTHKPINPITLL